MKDANNFPGLTLRSHISPLLKKKKEALYLCFFWNDLKVSEGPGSEQWKITLTKSHPKCFTISILHKMISLLLSLNKNTNIAESISITEKQSIEHTRTRTTELKDG